MPFSWTDTFSLLCSQLFSNYSIQAQSYGSYLQFDLVSGLRAGGGSFNREFKTQPVVLSYQLYVKTATHALNFSYELFSITFWEKLAQNLMFCYVSGRDYA